MRIALCVIKIEYEMEKNFNKILHFIKLAAHKGANLILFPEAALTGLINNDNPLHDLDLGIEIPGSNTERLIKLSSELNIYVGIGLFEKDGNKLFDSAILISPSTGIILKYRRLTPGWHGKNVDNSFYGNGKQLKIVNTELGSFIFLICGDLFDDGIVSRVRKKSPDWLLYPFARSFEKGTSIKEEWTKEKEYYTNRIKMIGTKGVMVNYIGEDGSFGGAMLVMPDGKIKAEMPVGKEGILYVDL